MRQPNRYSATGVHRTPHGALYAANLTLDAMIRQGGATAGAVVGYHATVEPSSATPAMLGDEPVDAVVEYAATVTVDHLAEEPS